MKKITRYKVTAKLQNSPGVLARITILLRKFSVNIQKIDASPIDERESFHKIHFILETTKSPQGFTVIMKKLQRLIPVLDVHYKEQKTKF